MDYLRHILVFISLYSLLPGSCYVQAERVNDKIYTALQSNHYCSRRLNGTHQVGCTSALGGNLGIVWIVEDDNDLEHILKQGPTPPYVAVLNRKSFTRKNLINFKQNLHRVAGVVFLDQDYNNPSKRSVDPFSPEDVCPNRYSGLYANDSRYSDCRANVWQRESTVSGLLYDDIPFPIFFINETRSSEDIRSCFNDHNLSERKVDGSNQTIRSQSSYPLCGMQLDSFMIAASNSKLCLNSHSIVDELLQSNGQRCYPVGNHNIFAYYKTASGPLQSTNESKLMKPDVTPKQSIVMLIAKLSSISMFSEISPGADSTITSIVTLLAVAEALGRVSNSSDVTKSDRNIVFALLDSEPFDYTGSSRMVSNMRENEFPNSYFRKSNNTIAMQNTNLTSIDYVIDIDQMANYLNSEAIHLHRNPDEHNSDKLSRLQQIMQRTANSEKVKLILEDSKLPLPPSPVHQFIKDSQELKDDKLTGIVLSNYGRTYNNLFHSSVYDDSINLSLGDQDSKTKLVEHLAQVAGFIAKSVFELTFNVDKSDDVVVDRKIVEQLLECYLVDAQCSLFTQAWQEGQKLPSGPIQTYKDPTKRSDDMNGAITAHLLVYFIGEKTGNNDTECYRENQESFIYNYQYINGNKPIPGVCMRSQVTMLSAQSPAYSYSDEGIVIDPKYSAWTVSLNSIRNPVRLYLKPSPLSQWCIFLLGIVITILSIIAICHVKYISRSRFEDEVQAGTPT